MFKFLSLLQHRDQRTRLMEIARILGRYGLADWLIKIPRAEIRNLVATAETQALASLSWEARIRQALTELGTTFIKLGQILSTRTDLVGSALADELRQLQAGTPQDLPAVVRATIEAELGVPPEHLFAQFADEALASASIAQVHQAVLPGGQRVIVKVQHAGIQDKVRTDLELMLALAELLQEYVADSRPYQPIATTREFQRTLLRELDFTAERRNLEQFARNFADDKTVHFPEVYTRYCSRRILTMELLEGIPGSEPDKMHKSGYNLSEFARRAGTMYLQMFFRDGFYHADPHPGNFMLLPGGVVGVLDCGMVGYIDDYLREIFEDLLLAVLQRDTDLLADLLIRHGSPPLGLDRNAFRADVNNFILAYQGQPLSEFDLGGALRELMDIIHRYRVVLPSAMALLFKTLIMLDGSAKLLSSQFSLIELLQPYRGQLLRGRLSPRRWLRKLRRTYRYLDRLLTEGPRDLADILERIHNEGFEVKHEHHKLEATVNRLVAGLLATALFVGSSLLVGHNVPPLLGGVSLPGALGCLTAVAMGTHLYWVVVRSLR